MRYLQLCLLCAFFMAPLNAGNGPSSGGSDGDDVHNPPAVVLGISNFLFETTMRYDPEQAGLSLGEQKADQHTYMQIQTVVDHVPHLHRLAGPVFQAILAMRGAFSEKAPHHELQLFGVQGAHNTFTKGWLEEAGIVWKGQSKEGLTGCCFTFLHDDASHFLVYPGVSCDIDLNHLSSTLNQDNIKVCFLSGFLLQKDAPFGRDALLRLLGEKLPRDKIVFFLPDNNFMRQNGEDFFKETLKNAAHVAGRLEDIASLFSFARPTLDQIQDFANENNLTFRLTAKEKGAYTIAPQMQKPYHHKPLKVQNPPKKPLGRLEPMRASTAFAGAYEAGRLQGDNLEKCGKMGLNAALNTAMPSRNILN